MKAFQHKPSMDEYDPLLAAYNEGNGDQRDQQGEIERDYEPEQAYGTAHDFQEHTRFGGTREDY